MFLSDLFELAEPDGPIAPFLAAPEEYVFRKPLGINLRYDPWFERLCRALFTSTDRSWFWWRYGPFDDDFWSWDIEEQRQRIADFVRTGRSGIDVLDRLWEHRSRGDREKRPIIIETAVEPKPGAPMAEEEPRSFRGFRVVLSSRAAMQAQKDTIVVGGASVAIVAGGSRRGKALVTSVGTIGGFVQSGGQTFGVTCGHVAGAVGRHAEIEIASKKPLQGQVERALLPDKHDGPCNDLSRGSVPAQDVALVRVSKMDNAKIEGVASITAMRSMSEGDLVEFYGASSGRVLARIRSACVYRELIVDGAKCCFGKAFEIERPGVTYLQAPPSREGDSGAWVMRRDSEAKDRLLWDGILVGADNKASLAMFAETAAGTISNWTSLPPRYGVLAHVP